MFWNMMAWLPKWPSHTVQYFREWTGMNKAWRNSQCFALHYLISFFFTMKKVEWPQGKINKYIIIIINILFVTNPFRQTTNHLIFSVDRELRKINKLKSQPYVFAYQLVIALSSLFYCNLSHQQELNSDGWRKGTWKDICGQTTRHLNRHFHHTLSEKRK